LKIAPLVVDAADLAAVAASHLERSIRDALAARGRCSVGLSGGNTPRPVYERLSRQALDWEKIDFYYADERCVPPGDKESNDAMARAALGPRARIHRMEAERKDREGAAADYAKLLPGALSVLVLGMGDDGHTCSLFPGFPALAERNRRVVFVASSPKPPPERLTITPPVIEAARSILMLASGKSKAKAIASALAPGASPDKVPASLAARDDALWVIDRDAASQLT
jgi:6-phosphogluconolactonase